MNAWESIIPKVLRLMSPLVLTTVLLEPARAQLGMTSPVDPPVEPCTLQKQPSQSPYGLVPQTYRLAPTAFLENDPNNGGFTVFAEQNGRLHYFLRDMAGLAASPVTAASQSVLVDAVLLYLGLTKPAVGSGPVINAAPQDVATAVAEIAVTGRRAYNNFISWHPPVSALSGPQDADLIQLVQKANPTIDPAGLQNAVKFVLDASYSALWAIRSNDPAWRARRTRISALNGWIAVSGEDDTPHRPVNVPTAPYPQYDLPVTVSGTSGPITATTRYMVASYNTFIGPDTPPAGFPALPQPSPPANTGGMKVSSGINTLGTNARSGLSGAQTIGTIARNGLSGPQTTTSPVLRPLPIDGLPNIPPYPNLKIIVYVHGGGSRLEEAVPLANNLILEAMRSDPNNNYVVISLDMPNSAYGDAFDPAKVYGSTYHPSMFHILNFEEQYVINFIEALDQKLGNIKNRVAAVMGGSLGGNMSLLLARESKQQYPYLKTLVAWSPTSMMPGHGTLGNGLVWNPDFVTEVTGGAITGNNSATNWGNEEPNTRGNYFHSLYFEMLSIIANLPPNPTMWFRDGWYNQDSSVDCKKAVIAQSRFDRYEVYSSMLRRWTTAIDTEQAMYSFQDKDANATSPRYQSISSRLLLVAGEKDCYRNGCIGSLDPRSALLADTLDIYGFTHDVANLMANTPGRTLFIKNTGHSIHDERPRFFAQEIVNFLTTPDATLRVNLGAGDTGLRWNSQVSAMFMTKGDQRMLVNIDLNAMLHPWPAFVISPNNPCGVCGELHHFQFPPDSQQVFAVDFSRTGFNLADIQDLAIQFTGGSRGPTDTADHFDLTSVTLAALNVGGVIGPLGTGIMFHDTGSGSAPAGKPLKTLQSPQDSWETTNVTPPQLPLPAFAVRLSSGTDANGPYVSIGNGPYAPRYWTQVPTWIQVSAVDNSNSPVQGIVTMEPVPPSYWDGTQLLEGAAFGALPSEYVPTQLQQTGQKFYYMCLPGGDPIWLPNGYRYPTGTISGSIGRPSNLMPFPGNQQGCSLQVSASGYATCVLQLGQASSSSGGILGGLLGSSHATGPGQPQPCPIAPSMGGSFATVATNTTASGVHAGLTGQQVQVQLPALAVTVSSNGPASSPVTDIITVTSSGKPVAGVTVSVGNSTFATNASGVVVFTHAGCFTGPVAKVGDTTAPKRTPVPCNWTGTANKAGYQTIALSLP